MVFLVISPTTTLFTKNYKGFQKMAHGADPNDPVYEDRLAAHEPPSLERETWESSREVLPRKSEEPSREEPSREGASTIDRKSGDDEPKISLEDWRHGGRHTSNEPRATSQRAGEPELNPDDSVSIGFSSYHFPVV